MFQSINHHIGPLPALALPELSNWSSGTAGSAWWIFHVHPQPLFHGLYTLPLSTGYSTWASRLLSLMNQKHEHPSWCLQPIQKRTGLWWTLEFHTFSQLIVEDEGNTTRIQLIKSYAIASNIAFVRHLSIWQYVRESIFLRSQWNYESRARLCALFRHLAIRPSSSFDISDFELIIRWLQHCQLRRTMSVLWNVTSKFGKCESWERLMCPYNPDESNNWISAICSGGKLTKSYLGFWSSLVTFGKEKQSIFKSFNCLHWRRIRNEQRRPENVSLRRFRQSVAVRKKNHSSKQWIMIELYCVGDSVWPFDDFFPFQKSNCYFFDTCYWKKEVDTKNNPTVEICFFFFDFNAPTKPEMARAIFCPASILRPITRPKGGGGLLAGPIDQKG